MPVTFTYGALSIQAVDTWLANENYTDLDDWADDNTILQTKATQAVSESLTIGTDLTVTGNLIVNGTTITINSTIMTVTDKNIIIANVTTPTDDTASGGGITLKGATDKTLIWNKLINAWESNVGILIGGTHSCRWIR